MKHVIFVSYLMLQPPFQVFCLPAGAWYLQSWSGAWNKFPLAVWTSPGSKGQIGQLEGLGQAVGRTLGLCVLWI